MATELEMATELDEDNIINALSGKPIIKACKNCKYYYKEWGSEANCHRDLKLDYHPVTGKKSWLGDTYRCNQERRIEDSTLYRSSKASGLCKKKKSNGFQVGFLRDRLRAEI
jgi:hypothetical protein